MGARYRLGQGNNPKSFEVAVSQQEPLRKFKTSSISNGDSASLQYSRASQKTFEPVDRSPNQSRLESSLFNLLKPRQKIKGGSQLDPRERHLTPTFSYANTSKDKEGSFSLLARKVGLIPGQIASPGRAPVPLQLFSGSPTNRQAVRPAKLVGANSLQLRSRGPANLVASFSEAQVCEKQQGALLLSQKTHSVNPSPKGRGLCSFTFKLRKDQPDIRCDDQQSQKEAPRFFSPMGQFKPEIAERSFFEVPRSPFGQSDTSQRDVRQPEPIFRSVQIDPSSKDTSSVPKRTQFFRNPDRPGQVVAPQVAFPAELYTHTYSHNTYHKGLKHSTQMQGVQKVNEKIMEKAKRIQPM